MRDEKGVSFQLNAIPLEYISSGTSRVYFPRPFLLLGVYKLIPDILMFPPMWPTRFFNYETPANQNTYSGISYNLFIELALANMQEETLDPATVKYIEPGIQATDYRGYFSKYLTEPVLVEQPQVLNTFLQPGKQFTQFCANNAASTAPVWENNFQDFLYHLQRITDKRLWGAPGVYEISENAENPAPWYLQNQYETFDEG
jgi:hypothetical protein